MKIYIKKLKELPDALNPNNIAEGFERTFETSEGFFRPPAVDERFWPCSSWSMAGVQEIIDDNTFRTYSSIYHWEIVKD